MAKSGLTEYERRRLENIKRNEEMIASIKRKADDLTATIKDLKRKSKPYRPPKPRQPPVVIRRSLRSRGISPDASPEKKLDLPPLPPPIIPPAKKKEPVPIEEAFVGESPLDTRFAETILDIEENSPLHRQREKADESWDPTTELNLVPENVRRLLHGRILSVCFFPFRDRRIIAAGDKYGHLGFWDADYDENGEGPGSYVFAPHSAPVSGILIHPFSLSKIFTCCYDGFIRCMDMEKNMFNLIYSTDDAVYSISHQSDASKPIFFGEGPGKLKAWDERSGKICNSWHLHEQRINTIDFNDENTNMMTTSSTDGLACIWDLRRTLRSRKPECVKTVKHARAVHSAFFSPNGSSIATTSIDDTVGILSGPNYDSWIRVNHMNQTGRWLSSFRAIWGWDDKFLFMGNMKRAVDIISTEDKSTVSLDSPHMSAIPCRFAAHPLRVGLLAGTTGGGQIYLWST